MPKLELQPQSPEPQLLASVRDYWIGRKGTKAIPSRPDILPAQIKKWLPQVLLAEAVGEGVDFRYRLVGSRLRQYFPSEPTGKTMSDILAPFGEETVKATIEIYAHVLTSGAPMRIRGDGAWYGQPAKYFDAILTPLSDSGPTATMVFGAFDFVWDPAYATADFKVVDDQVWKAAKAFLSSSNK